MWPVNSGSLFGGLVGLVVIVVVLALTAGIALSGNDLLNPRTSDAIAREKNQATQSKSQKDEIDLAAYRAQKAAETEKVNLDLANYKAIQAARAQAEQDKIQLGVQAYQRKLDQDLVIARVTTYGLVIGGVLTALILSAGVVIFISHTSRSRLAMAQAQAARIQMITQARATEVAYREAELVQAVPKPIIGGNGKHPSEPVENTMRRVT